jgi:hypothetical protein
MKDDSEFWGNSEAKKKWRPRLGGNDDEQLSVGHGARSSGSKSHPDRVRADLLVEVEYCM